MEPDLQYTISSRSDIYCMIGYHATLVAKSIKTTNNTKKGKQQQSEYSLWLKKDNCKKGRKQLLCTSGVLSSLSISLHLVTLLGQASFHFLDITYGRHPFHANNLMIM